MNDKLDTVKYFFYSNMEDILQLVSDKPYELQFIKMNPNVEELKRQYLINEVDKCLKFQKVG